MILRGQIPKDQLLFEVEIEMAVKRNINTKTKERQGDTREEFLTTFLFSIIFFRRKTTWQKSKHHLLGGYLEIMSCIKGQGIFLVLQYLLPPGPWR